MYSKTAFSTLIVAALLATGYAGPALADDRQTSSKKVVFRDLDLRQEADARTLLNRIRRAATSVCADGNQVLSIWTSPEFRGCVQNASSRAVADLNSPLVSRMFDRHSPVEIAKK